MCQVHWQTEAQKTKAILKNVPTQRVHAPKIFTEHGYEILALTLALSDISDEDVKRISGNILEY